MTDEFEDGYRQRRAAGLAGWDRDPERTLQKIAHLEFLLSDPATPSSGKFIDLGCGSGNLTLQAYRFGYDVTGVDLSPTAIAWARDGARDTGARFEVADVTSLDGFGDRAFDVAHDGYCLHCLAGEARSDYLKSVHRVLRSGGVFGLRTMCGRETGSTGRTLLDPADILDEIGKAGLEVVHSEVLPSSYNGRIDELVVLARRP